MKKQKSPKQNFSDDGAFSLAIGSMLGMTAPKKEEKEEKKDKDAKAKEVKEENKNADAIKMPPKASIQRQTAGRGGKVVTIVIFPKDSNADVDRIVNRMKKGLGCGARIEDGKIVLQGDIADRAEQWLQKAGVKKTVR